MSVVPPDSPVRIRAYTDRFPNDALHAAHVSPRHTFLKVLRVIVMTVHKQREQRNNTRTDDKNDPHLANVEVSDGGGHQTLEFANQHRPPPFAPLKS